MSTQAQEVPMSRRWISLSAVLLVCLAAFINMFKASPLFAEFGNPAHAQYVSFGFTPENIGLLMAASGIAGLILAFPAAWLFNKIGAKTCLVAAAAFTVLGAFAGSFASDFNMLFFTRIIEGIGIALLTVVAPAAVSMIIPREKLGLAMGFYSVMVPLGTVIAMVAAPSLYTLMGGSWQIVWIAGGIVALIALVYSIFFFKVFAPEQAEEEIPSNQGEALLSNKQLKPNYLAVFILALGMFIWGFFWPSGYNSFYSSYLVETLGFTLIFAGVAVAITSALNIVCGPLVGIISDRLKTRKWVIVFGFVGAAVMTAIGWGGVLELSWVNIIGMSIFAACVPTGIMAMAPEVARSPQKVGLVMAIIGVFANLGSTAGASLFPMVRAALEGSWASTALMLFVPMLVLGALATLFLKEKKSQ